MLIRPAKISEKKENHVTDENIDYMKVDATVTCFSLDGKSTFYSYCKWFSDDDKKVFKATPLECQSQKYITFIDELTW